MPNCRLCHSPVELVLSKKDAKTGDHLEVRICDGCGLVQQTDVPTSDELRVYYSHHYRADYKKTYSPKLKYVYRAGVAAKSRLLFIKQALGKEQFGSNLTLLDIGAGGGEFVYAATHAGFRATGIEPNQGYSEFARDAYGIAVETKHLDQLEAKTYNFVTMYHVLEHMPDPASVMERIYDLVSPGGHLVVEVPNIEQGDASPANIFFKAHLYYFSAATLKSFASPFFEPLVIEKSGNLKILFKRRPEKVTKVLPTKQDLEITTKRLASKGWFEYIFLEAGWKKPFRRLLQTARENRVKSMAPKSILNSILN